jgi:hypothetical protein
MRSRIQKVLDLALQKPRVTRHRYDVYVLSAINTGEEQPVLLGVSAFDGAMRDGSGIGYNFEDEVAGVLATLARNRGDSSGLAPQTRRKLAQYTEKTVEPMNFKTGCDEIDLVCTEVIQVIRAKFGYLAAIECNVGAFAATGNRLHAMNLALDASNYWSSMEEDDRKDIIDANAPVLESLRKAATILAQVIIPSNGTSPLPRDLEVRIRTNLESFCSLWKYSWLH